MSQQNPTTYIRQQPFLHYANIEIITEIIDSNACLHVYVTKLTILILQYECKGMIYSMRSVSIPTQAK